MNLSWIPQLLACPACRLDPNDPATIAANGAIGFMLIILIPVLAAFLGLIWKLARGEREAAREGAGNTTSPNL